MADAPAVDMWRRKFRLNLSASWKRDVEITIQDLDLWQQILNSWFYFDSEGKKRTKHPGIKGLLTEYERIAQQRIEDEIQPKVLRIRSEQDMAPRNVCVLPPMLTRKAGWQG